MKSPQRFRSGLVLPAATVALGPSRAITSHLRRRYHERYHGRFRFARSVFVFDLVMFALALALIGTNVWLIRAHPSSPMRYALTFSAPPLLLAAPITLHATITEQAGRVHHHVRLAWSLPPHTEILASHPPLQNDAVFDLGELSPFETREFHLTVRLMEQPRNDQIGFRVHDDEGYLSGAATRAIVGSGLVIEMVSPTVFAPIVDADFVVRVRNTTPLAIDHATLLTHSRATASGIVIPEIHPFESRLFLITHDAFVVAREIVVQSPWMTDLARLTVLLDRPVPVPVQRPELILTPWKPGAPVIIESNASQAFHLMIIHPALSESKEDVFVMDVPAGKRKMILPTHPIADAPLSWFVIPFVEQNGERVSLGVSTGRVTSAFHLTANAHYYTDRGDQIGIGPNPPRVGEPTTYWVTWTLGPTTADLLNVSAWATLPVGVEWTGKSAVPDGGTIVMHDGVMRWMMPSRAASNVTMTASFEIRIHPSRFMKGKRMPLLGETRAWARERDSDLPLDDRAEAILSDKHVLGISEK